MFLVKSALRIAPPLYLTKEQADHVTEIVERSTKDFLSEKFPHKEIAKHAG